MKRKTGSQMSRKPFLSLNGLRESVLMSSVSFFGRSMDDSRKSDYAFHMGPNDASAGSRKAQMPSPAS